MSCLYYRSKLEGILKFVSVVCFCVLLLIGLSACETIKAMGKTILRGHVNPREVDTGLPIIKIDTHNGRAVTSKEYYISADIEIIDPNNSRNNLKSTVEIRGRGNSTWKPPNKKPYRLKFPKKTSLFGYEAAKSWVLLANYQDTTLILNTTAFELGKRFGLPFTPHYTHAELIFNGEYEGSYVLTEQIQAGRGRVEIDENEGFLVELDDKYDEDPKFRTAILELPVMIKHPEDLEESSGYDFVKKALNKLEAALFADSFPNTAYRDLIDISTFVDFIMIHEITRNTEIQHPASIFMYRSGGEDTGIKMGPLWDFDYGFNYDEGTYFKDATGMLPYSAAFRELSGYKFFGRFFEDPYFRSKYKERWNEKYSDIVDMEVFIEQMAARLDKSQEINFRVWTWKKTGYKKEIARMKTWWRNRIEYLNTEINNF
jgi:spore coat protein CotH